MKNPPIVKATSATRVALEFLPSMGASSSYRVQYKLRYTLDETAYSWGVSVFDDGRLAPRTYTAIQDSLKPNMEYNFKITPTVKVKFKWYAGLASPIISMRTRAFGKN